MMIPSYEPACTAESMLVAPFMCTIISEHYAIRSSFSRALSYAYAHRPTIHHTSITCPHHASELRSGQVRIIAYKGSDMHCRQACL